VNAQRGNLPGLPNSLQLLFKKGFLSFRSLQKQACRWAMQATGIIRRKVKG
jgi:hypothetical protein